MQVPNPSGCWGKEGTQGSTHPWRRICSVTAVFTWALGPYSSSQNLFMFQTHQNDICSQYGSALQIKLITQSKRDRKLRSWTTTVKIPHAAVLFQTRSALPWNYQILLYSISGKSSLPLPVPPCVMQNALINQNLGKPPHCHQHPAKHTACTGSDSHPGNSLICIAVEQIHLQQKWGGLPLEQRTDNWPTGHT